MHEMPYTQALIEMALEKAEGRCIKKITLRVGWMSSIVPGSVQVFFDQLSKNTPAEGAVLEFNMTPIKLLCQSCERVIELPYDPAQNPRLVLGAAFRTGCPCGEGKLSLSDGLGFDLSEIEVEE